MTHGVDTSRALWNRSAHSWESDEMLAQILERGSMTDWRVVYRRAEADPQLRARLRHIVLNVPLPLPRFWLAALIALGEQVDLSAMVPDYYEGTAL